MYKKIKHALFYKARKGLLELDSTRAIIDMYVVKIAFAQVVH